VLALADGFAETTKTTTALLLFLDHHHKPPNCFYCVSSDWMIQNIF